MSAVWIGILYHGVFGAPFLYDDLDQVANNPALESWRAVWSKYLLRPSQLGSGFLENGGSSYRPGFWIALALERHVFGAGPAGFHFTSLLLHWINGVLLFVLLRRLKAGVPVAALATLVWLGLPVNSEAVAWVSGQLYPLSTAFLLLALLLALGYLRSGGWGWLAAFTGAALLANLSHEQGVLLVAFLALGYALLEADRRPRRWALLVGFALLADAVYVACRLVVGTRAGGGPHHPWSAGEVFWRYIQLIVLPVHMSVERSTVVPHAALTGGAVAAWVALFALMIVVIQLRRQAPMLAVGLSVVLVAVLPYCGFVYIYQGMAERYVYLASIGFALGITAAAAAARPVAREIAFTSLAIWMGWSAWRLMRRVEDWQDPIALYGHSLEATPESVLMNLNYGAALQTAGRQAEAESQYRHVISLAPKDSTAYVDLESLYIEEGRLDEAIAMYKQAVAVNPNDSNAYFDLGVMFQQRGQDREALAFYKKVLQLKPGDQQTLLYLSKLQGVQQ
ncbi:TPR Domain containing protein [Acidisarcina polymorpha]|uniref:TPR Domain containing protein n=1 Tax=Acidisarcina polymorpha TaxID=2211140 RepID=A0A2Z5FSK5_9BACT|nr:TPR Domain containing protein [Acidisarcina polymorpha]